MEENYVDSFTHKHHINTCTQTHTCCVNIDFTPSCTNTDSPVSRMAP